MAMKWHEYVLPGDLLSTAQEIDSAGANIERAIGHLIGALQHHKMGNFEQSRNLVNIAVDRLEDWEKSDNEMLAAFERKLIDIRKERQLQLLESLKGQGVFIEVVRRKAL